MSDPAPDAQPHASKELRSAIQGLTPTPSLPSITGLADKSVSDDSNPRSPKRRRISPPTSHTSLDIAAVAALAESLDAELASFNGIPAPKPIHQNGARVSQSAFGQPAPQGPPTRQTRIEQLPNLNEVATQILTFLAKLNQAEIGEMLFGPPSPRGQQYRNIKANFEQAKRIYLTTPPFLSPQALELREDGQIDILRKANLATFMASIFSGELGLRVMDMNFIDVFVPDGGKLLKAQASIYLELKTQAFVTAAKTAPAMLNQVMIDLFAADTEKQLLQKRPGAKTLAPSEQDFLTRLTSRRDILWSLIRDNKLANVHETYSWNNFSREVATYLTKHMESLTAGDKDRSDGNSIGSDIPRIPQGQMEHRFPMAPVSSGGTQLPVPTKIPPLPSISGADFSLDDFVMQAARAADSAMDEDPDFIFPLPSPPNSRSTDLPAIDLSTEPDPTKPLQDESNPVVPIQSEFQHYNPAENGSGTEIASAKLSDEEVPHSSQTAPTQVLYERARQVSTNSPSPAARKLAVPNQRRPWTTEEENALMTGIDQVKGPHWSQILAMYGPGGTINESLKDRNQVQLKDKARNLKLFFLKADIEVPYYLQAVTGDLKSRAPGQAEKLERERGHEDTDRDGDDLEANQDVPKPSTSDPGQVQEGLPEYDQGLVKPHAEQQDGGKKNGIEMEFDLEAMLAQAAAQVNEDLTQNPFI